MLQHEKTYTLDDGTKLRVVLSLVFPATGIAQVSTPNQAYYSVWAETKPKGGRTWTPVLNTESFAYRKMNPKEREQVRIESCLAIAGKDRIQSLADEFWQLIKPDVELNFN